MPSNCLDVGSQAMICDLPFRYDTYNGCTHRCRYCFANRKEFGKNLKVTPLLNPVSKLKKTIVNIVSGKPDDNIMPLKWIDWKLPIHWGGLSDPFQPIEKRYKLSLESLKVFAEYQYPFLVSTKGNVIVEPEYLNLIRQCNCAVQISMSCSAMDKYEPGAPCFAERLKMLETLSKYAKRTIVRVQPYIPNFKNEILGNIPKFKAAGAHGVVFEALKFVKKVNNSLEKLGGDFVYKLDILRPDFMQFKDVCHNNDLKFYSGENRLRSMGDDLCCCGVADMEGFNVNKFNINHLYNGDGLPPPSNAQKSPRTGISIMHSLHQEAGISIRFKDISFEDLVKYEMTEKSDFYKKVYGRKY